MKVLEIMGSLHRGGAETMIMNYYRAFDKTKCQMDFVIHAEFEDDYRTEAQALGANIFLLERPGKVGVIRYIYSLKQLIKNSGPYDAIHIHTNHQAFMAVIAGHRAGIKNVIVHSHNTSFGKKYLIINRLVMQLYNVKKIACGIAAGDAFFGKNNYIVLNNAIDLGKFRDINQKKCLEKKHEMFGSAFVIGNLGRLTKQKNHEFIIDLAKQISNSRNDIVFACYGEGEDEEKLNKIVADKNVNNIRFMGVTRDVITAYHMFDLFILPSLWEGFPVTLVESQLAGVYSLTSDKVSNECDMHIDMLKYLPLNLDTWENEIYENLQKPHGDLSVDKALDAYDVNIQWKKLYQIYCN